MPLDAQREELLAVGGYDLLAKIADGGMGSVYKAQDRITGQIVAVKVFTLPPLVRNREVLLKRFAQEFRAARSLSHPHLVRALDFGLDGDTPYLVMEFVDGQSLGDRIERDGRLTEETAVVETCRTV